MFVEIRDLLFDQLAELGLRFGGDVVDAFHVIGGFFKRGLRDGVFDIGELLQIFDRGQGLGIVHAVCQGRFCGFQLDFKQAFCSAQCNSGKTGSRIKIGFVHCGELFRGLIHGKSPLVTVG